jgi:hypothetical protein
VARAAELLFGALRPSSLTQNQSAAGSGEKRGGSRLEGAALSPNLQFGGPFEGWHNSGTTLGEVTRRLGVSRQSVHTWIAHYEQGGLV